MKKIVFLGLIVSLLSVTVSCNKKDKADVTDGHKGFYLKFQGYGLYNADCNWYRAYYLDGKGSGYYYWLLSDRTGQWEGCGEDGIIIVDSNCYYFQNNNDVKINYYIDGNDVIAMQGNTYLNTFKLNEYKYYEINGTSTIAP